jgi:hypothetical protein
MSDAMSDANGVTQLYDDAVKAAEKLKEELQAAEQGYRGLMPNMYELTQSMNYVLKEAGWEIRRLPR